MNLSKVIVKEITRISDVRPLTNVIYNNFSYLIDKPELGHNKDEISKLLSSDNFLGLFVYNNSKNIIGYIVGEYKTLNDGRYVYYITYLFVSPKYRDKKIGSQLVSLIIDKCKKNGIKYITLTCDTHDKKIYDFYKKRNFGPDPMLRNHTQHEVLTHYIN